MTCNPALEAVTAQITGRYGSDSILRAAKLPRPVQGVISTGIPGLDSALSGGIPVGRITEIYGAEGSGKTALALQIARNADGPALYIDADHGVSPAQAAGLYLLNVDTLEDALKAVELAAPGFRVIVIDTLTALPTREECKAELGDFSLNALPSAILAHALPRLVRVLKDGGCTLVLVNQTRTKPHILYGNPDFVPGGRALLYYAAVRIQMARAQLLEPKDLPGKYTACGRWKICGARFTAAVRKSKYTPPGAKAAFSVDWA